ncbi:retrotransposon protein, putative, ty1-copia subclass [Tanacetum coccineum]
MLAWLVLQGNGMRAEVEVIQSFDLILPSDLIIILDNCDFAPTVTKGAISISRLVKNGYSHTFTNYGISVLKDNVFYFNAIPRDGIYEIYMYNLYPNVSSMFNVSNNIAKRALDSSYLWHCRLGHINKKRMDKLQCDGILQLTHDELLEKCKSCISGKMASKRFPHQVERAKYLLGLIHTDVCGPFRTVSREGASYFITFTDDFNRYGYVYPMKHKHEVFETFKAIKNIIKSSGSDEGLESIQEEDTQPSENTSKEHNEVAPTEILVDLPLNGRTVRGKWLFKKKTNMDGKVHTFKTRLVAKGYTQTYSVDYGETFSPVADIRAIRILLAIAAYYDYEIWQMDVKTALLNGYLSEDVYMVQPEGFLDPKHPNKIGFTQNPDEPCVYLKASGSSVAFLVLYVDDILLMGNNVTLLQEVKSWLCKCFSMKDLGEAAYILGIKIIRNRSKRLIALSQSAYLEKTLNKFKMENSKKGYTPMIEKPNYSKSQGAKTPSEVQRMRRVPYASAIGSIIEIHWTAVKTILKYLRNTKDMVLVYGAKPKAELKVSCYADASFQTDKNDTKSQTGYVFVLNGGAVDWKSAKQSTTAMSSTKAEYIAAAKASMEAVWMRKFIDGLGGVMPSNKRPMEMLCDNEPAIAIVDDPIILKGARHFQRKYHYICEVIQEREIVLKKVHIDHNVVDPLTKPMPVNKHYEHARVIGIVPASSLM